MSAANESVPLPVSIVAPAATVRLPWAVTSTFPPRAAVVTLSSVRSPHPAKYTLEGWNWLPTTTPAGVSVALNVIGLLGLPIEPSVLSVTVPVVAMSGYGPAMKSMPPLPANRLMLPLTASKAGPPWVGSNTIVPGPLNDWTAATLSPGVAVGVASAKVILPVCVGSPKVIVPVAAVLICANSALVRLMPSPGVKSPPTLMGSEDTDVRITTPPGEGTSGLRNSLTVLLLMLATKRLPLESNARADGLESLVSVAIGVVLPGANTLTVSPALATKRLPLASKAKAFGLSSPPLRIDVAVVLPPENLLTVS